MNRYFKIGIWGAVGLMLFVKSANAYLDPGTGSMLLQGLIAAIAGGLVALRLYWSKIKRLFSTKEDAARKPADAEPK